MFKRNFKFVVLLLLVLLRAGLASTDVIDKIVATVNEVPILQSDMEDAIRFEAFLQQRSIESFTVTERQVALNRMLDQELIRQQMQGEFITNPAEVDARISEIRTQLNATNSPAEWQRLLAGYGLDERILRDRIASQLAVMRFVDLRLRPTVRIDPDAVEAYYRETLVPQLQQMGAPVDPLPSLAPKIRELLAQRRMDDLLGVWLANLRSQSTIHIADSYQKTAQHCPELGAKHLSTAGNGK